ncbi:MAG: sugar phosphate isomerase/epimerase family protein [Beutenbergiaceae bacterium]
MTSPSPADSLSINQITVRSWSFEEVIAGLQRHGLRWIGAWVGSVEEYGVQRAATLLRETGIGVSSVCRAGFFTGVNPDGGGLDHDANKKAVDLTAAIGADVLYLVAGGVRPSHDLPDSRKAVVDGIAELVPYAQAAGVKLAIEPLHPSMCAERSVVVTLDQAVDMAEQLPAEAVGIAVDSYNVWWDPRLHAAIDRAQGRIISYQVCDWLVPQPHPTFGRGIPGDGAIDIPAMTSSVHRTGYQGPIEVEIFNEAVWESDPDDVVATIAARYATHVLGSASS